MQDALEPILRRKPTEIFRFMEARGNNEKNKIFPFSGSSQHDIGECQKRKQIALGSDHA